ncbi:MAG: LPS-assembly protein LptD [Pseudomonadota bacterium]
MILNLDRLHAQRLRLTFPMLALLTTVAISAPVLAKDNKRRSCTANETGDGWNCVYIDANSSTPASSAVDKETPAADSDSGDSDDTAAATAAAAATVGSELANDSGATGAAAAATEQAPTAADEPAAAALVILPATAPDEAVVDPAPRQEPPASLFALDWVPIEDVPIGLRDLDCELCSGRYIDPLAGMNRDENPDDADIEAWANSTELQGDTVTFTGGVSITQGYRQFRGDSAVFNETTRQATLTGQVELREPGVLLEGSKAEINTDTGEATLEDGQFVIHTDHLKGSADQLDRDAEGLIYVREGDFSYCPPGDDDWEILADTIELDIEEGLGVARDAKLELGGVPVFYTPWLQFPLDDRRRTGLLWPDFGNDSTGGLDITAPIYFNLAPNYDLLYSPRFIQDRGLNHELKARYLNKYLGYWTVGGAYMFSDDKYKDQIDPDDSDDRWLAVVRQNGLVDQRWRSFIDYSKVSDVDYMRDLETSNLTAQRRTSLRQLASLDYLGDSILVNLDVEQYQSLAEDINDVYKKLPQLTAQYRSSGTPFELQPIALAQYSNFGADEDVVTGERVYAEGGLSYPMNWAFGFLRPTAKYRAVSYELSEAEFFTDSSPSAGSPMASLDGGLYFERNTSFAGTPLLQTLEPRLYYLYSEFENQDDQPDFDSAELTFSYNQLFRDTRFSGYDRIDDANRLSIGVSTQFIDAQDGSQLLSANIGQIIYFSDRKVRLNPLAPPLDDSSSQIAGDVWFTPDDQFSFRGDIVYDPHDSNVDSGNVLAGYTTDNGAIFNLGYSYNRPQTTNLLLVETEQVTASTYLPVNTHWRLFGAVNYSIIEDTAVEQMVGVEYENCCWIVRLMHLRYYDNESTAFFPDFSNPDLEQEHTTQLQFVLKGMGGFGSRIPTVLEEMIRGYQEREY